MSPIDKKMLSERDICTKFITPAIERAGWDIQTPVHEHAHSGPSCFERGAEGLRRKATGGCQ